MTGSHATARAVLVVLMQAAVCGPAAPPPPATVFSLPAPVDPVPAPAPTPVPIAAGAEVAAASTTTSVPAAPAPVRCRGLTFDLDALPRCPKKRSGEAPSQTSRLVVTLVPDAPKVASGETLGVSIVFTNKEKEPLEVDVHDGCSRFELGAYDARGTRRDYVVTDCAFGTGCGGALLRLVLEPGGTIVKHLSFPARVTLASSKTSCHDADAGGLPPGKYSLRATPMLSGWLERPDGPTKPKPQVGTRIEVTR